MKHAILVVTFLSFAGLALGETTTVGIDSKSTTKHSNSAAENCKNDQAKATLHAKADAITAAKASFIQAMKNDLASLKIDMDQLYTKIEKSGGATKVEAQIKLDILHEKWTALEKQLDEAQSSTESVWDEFSTGLRKSYSDLKTSIGKTHQWLNETVKL